MGIGAGIFTPKWLTDGMGGAGQTEASLRGESWQEDIQPIRNLNAPDYIEQPIRFECTANEVLTGYIRGVANAMILLGFEENDPNYKIQLYTDNERTTKLVTYYGDFADCYQLSQYIWGMAFVYDALQSGNIYYEFTNLKSVPFNFRLVMHGRRLR